MYTYMYMYVCMCIYIYIYIYIYIKGLTNFCDTSECMHRTFCRILLYPSNKCTIYILTISVFYSTTCFGLCT